MSSAKIGLVLASGSPRRRDLLEEFGYDFTVTKPEVEEVEDMSIPIRELTSHNARLKAEAVAKSSPESTVIAADTLVLLGDTVLSKPLDQEEASRMLDSLNGKSHQVFTAVTILNLSRDKEEDFTVTTDVHFKTLSPQEQAEYHQKINPMDKAGAYAAQEHGELIIDRIEGSMTNVIGLPMDEVREVLLKEFDISPDQ
ncbi:MAG: septum formation protein Maf [Verrucomicrobiales bacterium]|nr:septum formation protein Maf [Verrucomicrobiales bacterium]